jgi:hypothetical protein
MPHSTEYRPRDVELHLPKPVFDVVSPFVGAILRRVAVDNTEGTSGLVVFQS